MQLMQLEPAIPMVVVENPAGFPTGSGLAVVVADYGLEHHALWAIARDVDRAIWWVPNPYVRLQFNPSAGRIAAKAPGGAEAAS
jgi:hypothetical protein